VYRAWVSSFAIAALIALSSTPTISAGIPIPLGGQSPQDVPTLAPLLKRLISDVVNIAIKGRLAQEQNPLLNDAFFCRFFNLPKAPVQREIRAAGSGVTVDASQGLVITNNHVVEHADEITVTLADGRRLPAKPVGRDTDTDIAIVKIPASNLTSIPLGDSDRLEVGDFVGDRRRSSARRS
jgi:S1-C subfamily serine protease